MQQSNMYSLAKTWSPFVGCLHNCVYCKQSFQKQLKRFTKTKCKECYNFKPHFHPERLTQKLPQTHYMQFIFTCANGDISFCPPEFMEKILERIKQESGKSFLIQTKNPAALDGFVFPRNTILGCYDKNVRALTFEGFKNYKEVKVGDKVFTLNPKTREIEICKIKQIVKFPYKGMMIRIKGKRINLLVTPNHNLMIRLYQSNTIKFEMAETTSRKKCGFYFPKGHWVGQSRNTLEVDDKQIRMEDFAYLVGIFIGDGWTETKTIKRLSKTGLDKKTFLKTAKKDKNGWFKQVEEDKKIVKNYIASRTFLCIPKNDKARKRVEEALRRSGVNYHPYEEGVYFSSKEWSSLFALAGKGAKNKTIPKWLLEQDTKTLKKLFEGIMDSDGHEQRRLVTTSCRLLPRFTELCMKLGKTVHITKKVSGIQSLPGGRTVFNTTQFRISVADSEPFINSSNFSKEYYEGIVWCLSVGENRNYFIESNGTNLFCGNTTIETNRDKGYSVFSRAPLPSQRYKDFLKIRHPFKMVTVEPAMDFDVDVMIEWISNINPCMVWLGYDSKHTGMLPEPSVDKVRSLHWELSKKGFVVILKTIREEDKGKRGMGK